MFHAIVTFKSAEAEALFRAAYEARGGIPLDRVYGAEVQFAGDNAERAADVAAEVCGVSCETFDDGAPPFAGDVPREGV